MQSNRTGRKINKRALKKSLKFLNPHAKMDSVEKLRRQIALAQISGMQGVSQMGQQQTNLSKPLTTTKAKNRQTRKTQSK